MSFPKATSYRAQLTTLSLDFPGPTAVTSPPSPLNSQRAHKPLHLVLPNIFVTSFHDHGPYFHSFHVL